MATIGEREKQLRAMREAKAGVRKNAAPVTWPVTKLNQNVTTPVTTKALRAIVGKPCPLCGCVVPARLSAAERQRISRARRKGEQS